MSENEENWFVFKNYKEVIKNPTKIVGITALNNIILDCYEEMKFTKKFDDLPIEVRLSINPEYWNEALQLAKIFGVDESIYYTGFVAANDTGESMTLPLIIANDELAIAIAPKYVKQFPWVPTIIGGNDS